MLCNHAQQVLTPLLLGRQRWTDSNKNRRHTVTSNWSIQFDPFVATQLASQITAWCKIELGMQKLNVIIKRRRANFENPGSVCSIQWDRPRALFQCLKVRQVATIQVRFLLFHLEAPFCDIHESEIIYSKQRQTLISANGAELDYSPCETNLISSTGAFNIWIANFFSNFIFCDRRVWCWRRITRWWRNRAKIFHFVGKLDSTCIQNCSRVLMAYIYAAHDM